MKITIEAEPKEVAELISTLQQDGVKLTAEGLDAAVRERFAEWKNDEETQKAYREAVNRGYPDRVHQIRHGL